MLALVVTAYFQGNQLSSGRPVSLGDTGTFTNGAAGQLR